MVSGCHYCAAVTDVDGAEVKSARQGSVCLHCLRAGLAIPAIGPNLLAYFLLPLVLSVLTGWAEAPVVGSGRERWVQKAWSVNLGLPDRLPSQLPLAAYAAPQGS